MISAFTPPGCRILALKSGWGIQAGEAYTVRGFVVNRHAKTGEPDPHVLLAELDHPVGFPPGKFGEIGFPRDAFRIPDLISRGVRPLQCTTLEREAEPAHGV